jgi:hypothetical protein
MDTSRKLAVVGLAFAFSPLVVTAQSAQATSNILFRVLMVKHQISSRESVQGTMFSIDVDGRQYWITAKHIVTGAEHPPYGSVKEKTVSLEILHPQTEQVKWLSEIFSVIDPGADIDIVALAPTQLLFESPIPNPPVTSIDTSIGGDCEFLGFPFGNAWNAKFTSGVSFRIPFIKHCTVSGQIPEPLRIWFLDGINNAGFSGGPVIFGTGTNQKIMAVVSGYETEPSEVIPVKPSKPAKRAPQKEIVEVNSGFITAFDISYIVDAIKKNPIGPLVSPTRLD